MSFPAQHGSCSVQKEEHEERRDLLRDRKSSVSPQPLAAPGLYYREQEVYYREEEVYYKEGYSGYYGYSGYCGEPLGSRSAIT